MKRLTLNDRAEVLPALHGRRVEPTPALRPQAGRQREPKLRVDHRVTRATRFPVEQSLARQPESPWLGRHLDIEV